MNLWGPTIDMERKKYDERSPQQGVKCHTQRAWCPRLENNGGRGQGALPVMVSMRYTVKLQPRALGDKLHKTTRSIEYNLLNH